MFSATYKKEGGTAGPPLFIHAVEKLGEDSGVWGKTARMLRGSYESCSPLCSHGRVGPGSGSHRREFPLLASWDGNAQNHFPG